MLASGVVPQFLTDGTLWRLAVLWAALQLGELYQQRFFLGGWDERGLHWRAGLLQLAKWPYLGLALLDVLRHRQPVYEMTPKVRGAAKPRLLLRAHLPVVSLLGWRGWSGWWRVGPCPSLAPVDGGASAGLPRPHGHRVVAVSAPYDRRLWERHARGGPIRGR